MKHKEIKLRRQMRRSKDEKDRGLQATLRKLIKNVRETKQ